MSLRFEDVSEEQKECLTQTDEEGVHALFDIGGVASCAASRPSGRGEERIVVLYDSTDLDVARTAARCALYLKYDTSGVTMAKVTLERQRGPYIMDPAGSRRLDKDTFRCTREHERLLSSLAVAPRGYAMRGPFIF